VLGDIAYHDYSEKDHESVRESTRRWYRDFAFQRKLENYEPVDLTREDFMAPGQNIRVRVPFQYNTQVQTKRIEELEKFNVGLAKESHDLREELKIVQEERDLARLQLRARGVELTAAEDEIERRRVNIDKLESDLRSTQKLLDIYIKCANRRLEKIKKIEELENMVKVNSDLIELQARRLSNARTMICNISSAAGLAPPDLSSLDP